MEEWICKGTPSNPHAPVTNKYSTCDECGLPRPAPERTKVPVILKALGGVGLLVGAGFAAASLFRGPGDGQIAGVGGEPGPIVQEPGSGPLVTPQAPAPLPEVLNQYGIDLTYSDQWQAQSYGGENRDSPQLLGFTEVMDLFPKDKQSAVEQDVSIQIDLATLPRAMTLDSAGSYVRSKLQIYKEGADLGNYKNNDSTINEVTLPSGQPAYEITYGRNDGDKMVQGRIVFTMAQGNRLYIVHYQAPEQEYGKYEAEARAIADSLAIFDPSTSTRATTVSNTTSLARTNTFFCGDVEGVPTVFARKHWGNTPLFSFVRTLGEFDGWTPQARCNDLAKRFSRFHDEGLLIYLEDGLLPPGTYGEAKRRMRKMSLEEQQATTVHKVMSDVVTEFKTLKAKGEDAEGQLLNANPGEQEQYKRLKPIFSVKQGKVPVICTSKEAGEHGNLPPNAVGLLLTLHPDDNVQVILDAIREITFSDSIGIDAPLARL